MKAEIRLSSDINEPYVIIHSGTLTPEVEALAKRIENENLSGNVFAVRRENLIYNDVLWVVEIAKSGQFVLSL